VLLDELHRFGRRGSSMYFDIRIDVLQQGAHRIGDKGMIVNQQDFHRVVTCVIGGAF